MSDAQPRFWLYKAAKGWRWTLQSAPRADGDRNILASCGDEYFTTAGAARSSLEWFRAEAPAADVVTYSLPAQVDLDV